MPRLPHSLLLTAHHLDPLLPLLLRECRDLPSARNELRWLREHVSRPSSPRNPSPTLLALCHERSRGKPLQYILGSQPFGPLDILCRRGVLIPRPETETYTLHLASLLARSRSAPRRILDLCTGSGCIALLLHALLAPHVPALSIVGVDISPHALLLAAQNLCANIAAGHLRPRAAAEVQFEHGDVLAGTVPRGKWDVVVGNPPYISPGGFERETARSVRRWEPRGALVPPGGREAGDEGGDRFYGPVLRVAEEVGAKVVVVEVAGSEQAERVVGMVGGWRGRVWEGCEVWHDGIGENRVEEVDEGEESGWGRHVGEGHGRAVVCWREEGREWLGLGRER